MRKQKGTPCYCHLSDGHGTFIQLLHQNRELKLSLMRYNVNKWLFIKMAFGILFKKKPLTISLDINKELKESITKGLTTTTWYV
jgi:hypothetical protein